MKINIKKLIKEEVSKLIKEMNNDYTPDRNAKYHFDYEKISDVDVDGIDYHDAPDFVNAYIVSADYEGRPMTDDELDDLNDNHRDFVYSKVSNEAMDRDYSDGLDMER